uniref:Uncharacterized protein n=1 Tax=Rhipicephalus pulchellus TaxID=72859 RepID=L7LRZ1_RHIPC
MAPLWSLLTLLYIPIGFLRKHFQAIASLSPLWSLLTLHYIPIGILRKHFQAIASLSGRTPAGHVEGLGSVPTRAAVFMYLLASILKFR